MMRLIVLCTLVVAAIAIEDCGSETPSLVKDCDKPDAAYCGTSCCGMEVTTDAAVPATKVFSLLEAYIKTDKAFTQEAKKEESFPDEHSTFFDVSWKNALGDHHVEITTFDMPDDDHTPQEGAKQERKYFLSSVASYDGNDNGQNHKILATMISEALAELTDKNSTVEYGCGAEHKDGDMMGHTDLSKDEEFIHFLKDKNFTYEQYMNMTDDAQAVLYDSIYEGMVHDQGDDHDHDADSQEDFGAEGSDEGADPHFAGGMEGEEPTEEMDEPDDEHHTGASVLREGEVKHNEL